MPTFPKLTSQIQVENWTTIQHRLTGAVDFDDTVPSDDLGGPGPFLVFENGVYKYPEQLVGGRFDLPTDFSTPVRLTMLMADFGASVPWELHVAGTANTTDTPYPSGDALLYAEGDITVFSATSRYVSRSFNPGIFELSTLIFPGQHVYIVTTGATGAVLRMTFARAVDTKI